MLSQIVVYEEQRKTDEKGWYVAQFSAIAFIN